MKILDKIDRFFMFFSMISLLLIMVIVATDGLLRQFFDSPIQGAQLLIENYLMVAMIFPAFGYAWAKNRHVSIDYIYDKMPKSIQDILYLITIIITILVMSIIAYTGFQRTLSAFISKEYTQGLVEWPIWLAYIWVFIGASLLWLRMAIEFIQSVIRISKHGLGSLKQSKENETF